MALKSWRYLNVAKIRMENDAILFFYTKTNVSAVQNNIKRFPDWKPVKKPLKKIK